MKVVAFSTSSNTNSINKKIATYAANLVAENMDEAVDIEVLDLNDYELPLFSVDLEQVLGQPQPAKNFFAKLGEADFIVMCTADHNSNYPAVWKNMMDWCSRIKKEFFQGAPMLLLSSSPGGLGGSVILGYALKTLPFFGTEIKAHLSIGKVKDHFNEETGKLEGEYNDKLIETVKKALGK